MTTFPYVILSDSEGIRVKRFRAIKMATPFQNNSTFQITAGGGVDKQAGSITRLFYYTFKVYADAVDPYGNLDDLQEFFLLNNPTPTSGSPSDLLTLVDHLGETHYVKFRDDIAPQPVTTQLEGPNALYYIDVNLIRIPNSGIGS